MPGDRKAWAIDRWGQMAKHLSLGDDDLHQELLLEICKVVEGFRTITDGLMRLRLLRCRLTYWRGRGTSLDTGASTRRMQVYRLSGDIADWDLSDGSFEDVVLFGIGYERFLQRLSDRERAFWLACCDGMTSREIAQAKIAPRNAQARLRRRLRLLFRECFEV